MVNLPNEIHLEGVRVSFHSEKRFVSDMLRKLTEQEADMIAATFGGSHVLELDLYVSSDPRLKQFELPDSNLVIVRQRPSGSYFVFNPNEDDWEIIDDLMMSKGDNIEEHQ